MNGWLDRLPEKYAYLKEENSSKRDLTGSPKKNLKALNAVAAKRTEESCLAWTVTIVGEGVRRVINNTRARAIDRSEIQVRSINVEFCEQWPKKDVNAWKGLVKRIQRSQRKIKADEITARGKQRPNFGEAVLAPDLHPTRTCILDASPPTLSSPTSVHSMHPIFKDDRISIVAPARIAASKIGGAAGSLVLLGTTDEVRVQLWEHGQVYY
ncbi:hypothetical protein PILCRDRAFT_800925 [Piloderma croceum F 1598]|uniref:Uncharacterized protein n=1 Tax=Piloderma croceum (strain F 1598) TaxID=765440 RepID=A0A0C3F3M6_PILCF|nr:hypothetical protein PILCRDRAFT_800925 [Piloderma croceum F 1598]